MQKFFTSSTAVKTGNFIIGACFALCPLLFYTDLTRNPYFTQIALLNIFLPLAMLPVLFSYASGGTPRRHLSAADWPFAAWMLVCLVSLVRAYFGHAAFFRESVASEGFRNILFVLVNSFFVYWLSKTVRLGSRPFDAKIKYQLLFVAVSALWLLYPSVKSLPQDDGILNRFIDPYGLFVWAVSLVAVWFALRDFTQEALLQLAIVTGFIAAVYGVMQFFGLDLIWSQTLSPYGARSVSTFGNPNFLSSFLAMLLPLVFFCYLREKEFWRKLFYGAAFAVYVCSLLTSLTRSSWIGAMAGLCLPLFFAEGRTLYRAKWKSVVLLLIPVLVLAVAWPSSPAGEYKSTVQGRVTEVKEVKGSVLAWPSEPGKSYGPWHQRLLIWAGCYQMGAESPWLGKGWGLLELFYPFYQGPLLMTYEGTRALRTHANNAHNEILEIWSQTGIIGLGLYALFFAALFAAYLHWRAAAADEDRKLYVLAIVAGLAAMLADNMLNVSLHFAVPGLMFWWLAGAAAGIASENAPPESSRFSRRVLGLIAWSGLILACALAVLWFRQWMREVEYFRGFKYVRKNELIMAQKSLENSFRWHGREVNGIYELASCYIRMGNFDRAEEAYREALNANAGYDEIYGNLGVLMLKKKNDPASAESYLLASAFINPSNAASYNMLSELYVAQPDKYYPAAVRVLEQAVKMYPDNPNFGNTLAYFYVRAGRKDDAKAQFRRIIGLRPSDRIVTDNYSRLLAETGGKDDETLSAAARFSALESYPQGKPLSEQDRAWLRQMAEKDMWRVHAGILMSRFYYDTKDFGSARKELEKVLAGNPRSPGALFGMAMICKAEGDKLSAESYLRKVLEIDAAHSGAQKELDQLSH